MPFSLLDTPPGLCLPPFALIGRCLQKIRQEGATVLLIYSPGLVHANVVSGASGNACPLSDIATPPQGAPSKSIQHLLARQQLQSATWRVSGVPTHCQAFHAELQRLCQRGGEREQIQPTSQVGLSGLAGVLWIPFLAMSSISHFQLFDSGLQQCTINVVCSAVSMTHERIEGLSLGQQLLVNRLMKGVYKLRPPRPRYSYTWDVDLVVQYIASMGDNSDLPLKRLSQKLAFLMALVVASRTSELQALDLRYRAYRPNEVLF